MIDRVARNAMIEAIQAYRDEQITAFEFDDRLSEITDETKDQTVKIISRELWLYYDDYDDHKIVASKAVWDYFHRLLLLLESDAELERVGGRRWTGRQWVACLCLAWFGGIALTLGFGEQLFLPAIFFGFISMGLSRWRRAECSEAADLHLMPFVSLGQLRRMRRTIGGFMKKRYPPLLEKRRIRSRDMDFALRAPHIVDWLLYSPVALLFQAIPENHSTVRVALPSMQVSPHVLHGEKQRIHSDR